MSPENGIATIEAAMPQIEAQQYSTHLRALTQGRGTIAMKFDHYGEVPQNLVHKIIEEHEAANAVKV
jgi:elongation factor G